MSRKSASKFVEVCAFEKEKGGFWIVLFLGNLQILLKRVFVLPLDDTVCYNLINILFMMSNSTKSKIKQITQKERVPSCDVI